MSNNIEDIVVLESYFFFGFVFWISLIPSSELDDRRKELNRKILLLTHYKEDITSSASE